MRSEPSPGEPRVTRRNVERLCLANFIAVKSGSVKGMIANSIIEANASAVKAASSITLTCSWVCAVMYISPTQHHVQWAGQRAGSLITSSCCTTAAQLRGPSTPQGKRQLASTRMSNMRW